MPQRFGLYEDMTIAENIFFYATLFAVPAKVRRERGQELLQAAGLAPFRGRLAGQLSGGMKQKLGLVCALIHTPRVLLLDEPTTGVDPVSRRDFWGILYGLREQGVTILLSTAYMDEAERCSRLALLHAGRIRSCDTPARLKQAMQGALLAVATANVRAAHAALVDAPGVLGALLMGDRVNVRVDDAERRLPELAARLAAAGIGDAEITPIEPGIEDVFVALMANGDAA
jgi:ABC-2 type transport system ATP-binding protein